MCSLTNEFTIDNKSENNLRYSKVFLHHYYLLWIFFFLLCCISANYISSKTNAHCCMYKSIQKHRNDTNDKIILTDKYACISIISFLFHSFFLIFKFTQPQVRIIYNKTPSVQAHNGHANMTIFFFL